jgi:hypothetical protein
MPALAVCVWTMRGLYARIRRAQVVQGSQLGPQAGHRLAPHAEAIGRAVQRRLTAPDLAMEEQRFVALRIQQPADKADVVSRPAHVQSRDDAQHADALGHTNAA